MDCSEAQSLLSAYLDHELDLIRSLEVEKHLKDCVVCSENYKAHQSVSKVIADAQFYHKAPVSLQERIHASLRPQTTKKEQKSFVNRWQWLAYAASFVFVFLLGWMLGRVPSAPTDSSLDRDLISSHVRSLMPGHLTDVLSSDQHTVKPWFNGKLDFSPSVKDFTPQGFPLFGARLDYVNRRTIAALVYKRNQHIINLFVCPSSNPKSSEPNATMIQGYHIIGWSDSGISYSAVSDLNEQELRAFVTLYRHNG